MLNPFRSLPGFQWDALRLRLPRIVPFDEWVSEHGAALGPVARELAEIGSCTEESAMRRLYSLYGAIAAEPERR